MTLDGIELPDDLLWVDEFDWNPVAQDIERSLTGALMVQEQPKLHGRPITLTGGDEAGWVTRGTVLELMSLVKNTNETMMLTLFDGREFSVVWDRASRGPMKAQPVFPLVFWELESFYKVVINLITIYQ